MYNGTVSGAFKDAIDWLHVLGRREPPYLHDTVVGLISAAGATVEVQPRTLGAEVVRVAARFAAEPAAHRQDECDRASERVAAAATVD
jgi:NAD(P)H-dependent FMN reductase